MDDAFLAAIFPGRYRVLGRTLGPYCRGHLAALHAVSSPFVSEQPGARITAGDLLVALRICALPGYPFATPEDWRPRWRDRLLIWWLERHLHRLRSAVEAFERYQDAHASFPTFYDQDPTVEDEDVPDDVPQGRPLSAPYLLAQVCALISRTSLSWDAAWRMPLALPTWTVGTLDEMEGASVRFLDETDDTEDSLPPDVTKLTEKELYRQAVAHIGKEAADAWRENRRAERRKARRKRKGKTT